MNKTTPLVLTGIIIIVFLSGFFFWNNQNKPQNSFIEKDSVTKKVSDDTKNGSRYVNYSVDSFDAKSDKKRVLFFHAGWCPTCKVANETILNSLDQIPLDVVLFKTDYDSEGELKKKYNITYQHTYVLVDQEGTEIKKWNGGAIDELIQNTK